MSNEIDTEKIRELNESLRELTGSVNVAEQAVEKIVTRLGFGDKLKKKVEERTEAEDKATTSIDKSTAAIDEERKKREETSKAQAEQFRKELSYRKVAVDANNELVSTAVQLSKAQRDTLRLADQLNKKEREKLAYKDDPGKTVSGLTDKFSASGAVLNSFNDQIGLTDVIVAQRCAEQRHSLVKLVLFEFAFFDLCFVVFLDNGNASVKCILLHFQNFDWDTGIQKVH
jgi:predicted RNA-binding protein with RPS1 domain